MDRPDPFDAYTIKHLEMVQAVISRLGTDSFLVKGWSVTVVGAFLGFAVTTREPALAIAGVGPTLMFWCLDSYFLYAERLFRCLFDCVRKQDPHVEPFFMAATSQDYIRAVEEHGVTVLPQWKVAWRPTLRLLYGAQVAGALAVAAIAASLPAAKTP